MPLPSASFDRDISVRSSARAATSAQGVSGIGSHQVVPHRRLFTAKKDNPLDHGIDERTGGVATQFLQTLYVSTSETEGSRPASMRPMAACT